MRRPARQDLRLLRGHRDVQEGLLVDYWYSHAVGHMVEALRVCLGYATASPELPISLVVNAATPVELGDCCGFVRTTYGVDYHDFGATRANPRRALRGIPRDWEWIVEHPEVDSPSHATFTGYQRYYAASRAHFRARRGRGPAGAEPPPYVPHQPLRLDLPADARERARRRLEGRPAVCVLPAGSSRRTALYPSRTSWRLVLDAIAERHPDHCVCVLGRHPDDTGRTASGFARSDVAGLGGRFAATIDLFDVPLLDQLAFVEASDLFLSPHTGFAFAALAVGTPWLAISGGDWHETFFNGVPFHSVLPDPDRFGPCFVQSGPLPIVAQDDDGEGERTTTMCAARIRADLDEIVDAATRLIEGRVDYEEALAAYFPRLLRCYEGDRSRIHTFDHIHERYLPSPS